MKTLYITLFLFLISIYFTNCYCPEYFKGALQNQCENLVNNDTHYCSYSNGECTTQQKLCTSYTGTDEQQCNSIKPKDSTKKCTIKDRHCTEVPKECKDFVSGITLCSNLDAGDDKQRCVLSGGKCLPHYKSCEDFTTGVTEALCNANIPSTSTDKCIWDSSGDGSCKQASKKCKDYEFAEHNNCNSLEASDENKICLPSPIGFGCVEQYKTCELYEANEDENKKSKKNCEAIIYIGDGTKACYFSENNECLTRDKKCYDISPYQCLTFDTRNEQTNCILVNDYQCKEQYRTCEIYDSLSDKNEKECNSIVYYGEPSSKCVFENNHCTKKKKECKEITDSTVCNSHVLDDTNKMCVFENGQCKEEYKSCSDYNNVAKKNEKNCKAIKIYSADKTNVDYTKKCIYKNNVCQEESLTQCSDYDSDLDKKYCTKIDLGSYKKCVIKDNKCTQIYITCPENREEITKEECESIIPLDESKKCNFEGTNNCAQKEKECSEYTGTDSYVCQKCISTESDKKCFIENRKCVAKYTECEKYAGNDSEICKKIIPYDNIYGDIWKCVMGETNCEKALKKCEEVNSYQECESLSLQLTGNKNCVFIGGKCKEQYKDCQSYNVNGVEAIKKDICESIVIKDITGKIKCSYTESGSCEISSKECTDFKPENYAYMCGSLPDLIGKTLPIGIKCFYTNSECSDINQSCSELSSNSDVTNEICAVAPTSYPNRKQCELKSDGTGCQEIDKIIADEDEDDNGSNSKENKSNFCLNEKSFIINFVLIMIGLLL